MFKKIIEKLDYKYVKICFYGICSVLIAFICGLIIFHSRPFFLRLWSIICAVLKPLIFGLILYYLISPLTDSIEKKLKFKPKTSRVLAVIITLGLAFLIVAGIVILIYIALSRNLANVNFVSLKELYLSLEDEFKRFFLVLESILSEGDISMPPLGDVATSTVQELKNTVTTAIFSVVFAVHFLLDGKNILAYWKRFYNVIVDETAQNKFDVWMKEADTCFSGYIRGQFIDAATVGLLCSVFLRIFNVPYAPVIGALTGLGNLIPYLGGVMGFGSLAIACLATGNIEAFVIGAICISVIMMIDSNIINPMLLSNNVNVHPILVVASLIAGGAGGGLAGMLVAVPTGAFLKLQLDHYIDKKENEKATVNSPSVE